MDKIVLLGSGGHAKSVIDSILSDKKFEIVGFIDNENRDFEYMGYKVIGCDENLPYLYSLGIRYAFICIGFLGKRNARKLLYEKLKKIGFELPVIIDPTVVVAQNVIIGEGTFIGKGAIVNSNVVLGKMAIINTSAIIEHDCVIKDFTHISVGSVICGVAQIGEEVFVGANATVIQEICIGDGAVIGAGSVVTKSIYEEGTYVGVPVRKVK